jgi:hypothetical protein
MGLCDEANDSEIVVGANSLILIVFVRIRRGSGFAEMAEDWVPG